MNTSHLKPLVVIGAQKCGTTTFSHDISSCIGFEIDLLSKEESILLSLAKSETNHNNVISHFTPYKEARSVVDVSTLYSQFPLYNVPVEQIYKVFPQLKIVYIVREPMARLLSHYSQSVLIGQINESASDVIEMESDFVQNSLYGVQLQKWRDFFPLENILLVKFEDYINNRQETIRLVADFVGVDSTIEQEIETTAAKNVTAERDSFHPLIHKILSTQAYHRLVRRTLGAGMRNSFKKIFRQKTNADGDKRLDEATESMLFDAFKKDSALLNDIYPNPPTW